MKLVVVFSKRKDCSNGFMIIVVIIHRIDIISSSCCSIRNSFQSWTLGFKDIEILFTGAHEQNYPICIFHLVQGHDFVITRKKRKYAYLYAVFFFRNLNVLSKAKPTLKTL